MNSDNALILTMSCPRFLTNGRAGWFDTAGSVDRQMTCRDPLGQEDPAPYAYRRADRLRRIRLTCDGRPNR